MKAHHYLVACASVLIATTNGVLAQKSRIRVVDPNPPADSRVPEPEVTDNADGSYSVRFPPNADVQEVLSYYERLTRKRIVASPQVVGPVTLGVDKPVPRTEAILAIEQALFAAGFALIDLDKTSVQVLGIGQNPSSFPVPVYSKLEDLPEAERVVSMVFKLKHRDVTEFAIKLQQTRPSPPWMQGVNILPDPKSKSVIVTDRTSSVRQIALLISELDVPEAPAK